MTRNPDLDDPRDDHQPRVVETRYGHQPIDPDPTPEPGPDERLVDLSAYRSITDAARLLGLHPSTLRRKITLRQVHAVRVGGRWYLHLDDLEAMITVVEPGAEVAR